MTGRRSTCRRKHLLTPGARLTATSSSLVDNETTPADVCVFVIFTDCCHADVQLYQQYRDKEEKGSLCNRDQQRLV